MLYKSAVVVALLGGADAFQAGPAAPRSRVSVSRKAVSMQVAEAEVAAPVALAKVRAADVRCCLLQMSDDPSCHDSFALTASIGTTTPRALQGLL